MGDVSKFLDDMELIRAEETSLAGKRYRTIIESPYRWRDWAAKEDGITGDDLIAFINNDEAKGRTARGGRIICVSSLHAGQKWR